MACGDCELIVSEPQIWIFFFFKSITAAPFPKRNHDPTTTLCILGHRDGGALERMKGVRRQSLGHGRDLPLLVP